MNIEEFCNKYNLGKVIEIDKITGGLIHKMYKVKTNIGIYAIKELNPEVMTRKEAFNNFIISEKISNYAKENDIPVSNALLIDNNFINEFNNNYYMVFDFIEGKTISDDEITIENCKRIGNILAKIHSLDYKKLNINGENKKNYNVYDFDSYIRNPKLENMLYKDKFLNNYKKYSSLQERINECINSCNNAFSICHRDMDPKNVIWKNNNPIIIDWESASISNPYLELVETALCWSGFLSNNFDEIKFKSVIEEYTKIRSFEHNRYNIICSGLISKFDWLKYNLDRSLNLIPTSQEDMKLAENEVDKTIDEINNYQLLVGKMYKIICDLTKKENHAYDEIIKTIIKSNDILNGLPFKKIDAGFTNTIYSVDKYIIRICTDFNNEEKFRNEINFYKNNKNNTKIPKLYKEDTTKKIVPYYYEIIENVNGKTIYELWPKLNDKEREEIVIKIIDILKTIHSIKVSEYDFKEYIKNQLKNALKKCNKLEEFSKLFDLCDKYFEENKFGLIHGDLHFDNFICDKNKIYLIDFERVINMPIDYDFRIFYRCKYDPWKWASASTDILAIKEDYQNLIEMFIENYDELRSIKYLKERLDIYLIIDLFKDYNNLKDEKYIKRIKEIAKKLK